jgi:hypothetical protein
LLIRGFRPAQDIAEYGRDLFPLLRAAAALEDGKQVRPDSVAINRLAARTMTVRQR